MSVHLKGLERMVTIRGGTVDGGFEPNVQRLIAWYFISVPVATGKYADNIQD